MAIVDEVTWEISQIDPKKTIQVGSFRIDSHGNQNLKEVGVLWVPSHYERMFIYFNNSINTGTQYCT